MLFPTAAFLAFYVVAFSAYWAIPRHRPRMLWLTAASAVFYMAWDWRFIFLIVGSTCIDFFVARHLPDEPRKSVRKRLVALSVVVNLSVLAFFKYSTFALMTTNEVTHWLGWSMPVAVYMFVLPLGISFYTFEAISYVVDVYRGTTKPIRNPLDYSLYIMFFPHLVAGPIVRANEFVPQIARPKRFDWPRFQTGAQLFLLGLFKKSVIADQIAASVDPVFASPGEFATAALWLATVGYAIQIYCDFSGYTDMALGLAHTLGFKLPHNFNAPYLASSPTDFWRRWHTSLSRWLRDYLYIPLGGNRKGPTRTMVNLFLTMLLGGLWHGPYWTFVVWGAYHGLLLALQRFVPATLQRPAFRPLGIAITFVLVMLGWVVFRAETFEKATTIYRGLFVPTSGGSLAGDGAVLIAVCFFVVMLGQALGQWREVPRFWMRVPAPLLGLAMALVLTLALMLTPGDGKAFIYFQF